VFGRQPLARQAETHALIAAADAGFAVSLAGSLFFSVSVDAARPRIILYLVLTMAPFAVVASLIGPLLGRVPGGHRLIEALTSAGRGLICLQLARELRTLAFYPLAFSVLVLGKTYSVAKNALVPRLVSEADALVEANSRLSRVGTLSGALASGIAAAVLVLAGAPWTLALSSVLYFAATALALGLPRSSGAAAAQRTVEREVPYSPALRRAASAMGVLRGAEGFLLFAVAFVFKQAGEPAWFFGAALAAYALGGLAGTFVAPLARRAVGEEALLAAALGLSAALATLASLGPGRLPTLIVAVVLGINVNAGRRAFDSLVQRDAADFERGRLFARFETRLQLWWVTGALLAVAARPPLWASFLVVGLATGLGAVGYVYRRAALARTVGERVATGSCLPGTALAVELLATAERLYAENAPAQAVIVAAAAADVVARALDADAGTAVRGVLGSAEWEELQQLRRDAADGAGISPARAERAVTAARRLLSSDSRDRAP
jgi:hypothetical protein